MKKIRIFVLIFLVAIAAPFVTHYRAWARQSIAAGTQPADLRIVAPKPGEKLAQTFVAVQYQLMGPASAQTYELRLDGRDPVQTTDTTYTFNGLTSGSHDLIVQMVDANGTPIMGTRSEVKFVTVNPPAGSNPAGLGPIADLPPPPLPVLGPVDMPNSSLPLLSIIGFGILVGGVISALRTRPVHR
jgi:hypothetical protein